MDEGDTAKWRSLIDVGVRAQRIRQSEKQGASETRYSSGTEPLLKMCIGYIYAGLVDLWDDRLTYYGEGYDSDRCSPQGVASEVGPEGKY